MRGVSEKEGRKRETRSVEGKKDRAAKGSAGAQGGVYREMVILEREKDEVGRDEDDAADAVEIVPGAGGNRKVSSLTSLATGRKSFWRRKILPLFLMQWRLFHQSPLESPCPFLAPMLLLPPLFEILTNALFSNSFLSPG